MDEKTEELRDIFLDVADADTVTESQEETHGSLASEEEVERRLAAAVSDARDDLGFETDLDDDGLVTLVRGFYAGEDDATLADGLDADADDVADARLDLHLVRDDDATLDLDALRDHLDESANDADDETLADALDADESAVRWHRRLLDVRDERRRLNDRYRLEFESILQDRDIAERLTANVHEDGLADATDGMENDLSH